MGLLVWILQIIAFLVVWKVVHLLYWNARKLLGSRSLLLTMFVTFCIALLAVILFHAFHTVWAGVLIAAFVLGIGNAEYELNREAP
ncbi:hypothetical protein [Ferroacidibacillus organovorans]|uniref:Uncharacterized protein n=1 Tax=Ferroacidibacillus organovorans TaxID=1765683 RepID=A0A162UFW6_9BACL|nr:hypothetical protein [Ferroacidibacillus organovorans]KYP81724.1 hypothetical protein AYJ22_06285 [Ferroacidibacillus organovorans]OAG94264.1 hypothetical protein AYW79_06510 [Ferroacidibacillus organovorans]OPG16901.1 hypothetical protein B2M26_04055 [Ferroacidibacillus organovorans]